MARHELEVSERAECAGAESTIYANMVARGTLHCSVEEA
jgi:hypothetical protein